VSISIATAIKNLGEEFGLDDYDTSEITRFIEGEGFKPHVVEYAALKVLQMNQRGKRITSPKGLLVKIMREHRDMPEGAAVENKVVRKANPLAVPGSFDFWFGGDRAVMDKTCEIIIFGFDADTEAEQQHGLDVLSQCAPGLRSDELLSVLRVATDYERKFGTCGTWPMRLAAGCRRVIAERSRTTQERGGRG